ncbi:uncharacterized protein LOC128231187 [Mya arenaria]|uniref:uncharacterized protein LOC128231187 n=1 Tax=Mya arenaria TaxID=6604 RepID=UPI0022E6B285|nr:uncharacterized protein LOC128231187 [Mya arenaria]
MEKVKEVKLTSTRKGISSTQIVARQHMKKHLRRIRNKEYRRLRAMVPAVAKQQKVSKVEVIEEAVRYIDELHRALAARLGHTEALTGDRGSTCTENDTLKEFVHNFIPADFFRRRVAVPMVVQEYEKQQRVPSYLTQNHGKPRPAKFV